MITTRQDAQVHKIYVHRDDGQQMPDRPALLAALTDRGLPLFVGA